MAYSEKKRKWIRDIRAMQLTEKQVWINYNNKVIKFSRTQVIPQPLEEENTPISELLKQLAPFNSKSHPNILLTEILQPNDLRIESPDFDLAKTKEIKGLLDRKAFRVVLEEDLERDANVLGGRFVLTIRNKGTNDEIFRARFVVQGHLDREKELLVHASTTVSPQAIRLLVSLATIFGFRLWSEDMTLADIRGAERILRNVFVRGKPEFQLSAGQLLQVLRPLYGLADSGDYWHATFLKHLKKYIVMQSTACEFPLFFRYVNNTLQGMVATHVDDTLSAGNKTFQEMSKITSQRFYSKPRNYDTLSFAGVTIETREDRSRIMHQAQHANKIEPLEKGSTFERFRSRRHELAWILHTRPDITASASILSQVTQETFFPNHITQLNKAIKLIKQNPKLRLIVHQLDIDFLRIISYAVASFQNLPDLKTQLGFVVLLTDKTSRINWLHFRTYKYKRVVRSVLGGETHAFVNSFDAAYAIRYDLETIVCKSVSLSMVTDSDSLLKVIFQSSTTTERRLIIDIQAGREAYQERRIDEMGWVR